MAPMGYKPNTKGEGMKTKAAIIAILLAVACAQAQQPRGIETLEEHRLTTGPPTPNQSFVAKAMQTEVAACLSSLIHDIANTAEWVPGVWNDTSAVLYSGSGWRIQNQKFHFKRSRGSSHHSLATVTFSNARWDPNQSKITYGQKKLAQDVVVANDAKTKIIRNDSDSIVEVSYEEEESLTNSYTTSVTKGLTLDMTVSSETTVSGSYAGVTAEEKITAEFGVSESEEESKEESKEGSTTEKIGIEFDAEPGQYYLITITKEHATTYQDFTIDGVMDFDLDIYFVTKNEGREESHYPGDRVKLMGIDGLEQFVFGFDTNYPAMHGYWGKAYSRVKNGVNYILDPSHRRVQISGTNQASLDSNADYRVESLGSSIPDHLAHLPVEDADDPSLSQPPQTSSAAPSEDFVLQGDFDTKPGRAISFTEFVRRLSK